MRDATTFRFNDRKFRRMAAAGMFGEVKVELLNGVPTMMTSGPGHDHTVSMLDDLLKARLPLDKFTIREEKPIAMGRFWTPVPDIFVLRGERQSFSHRTPGQEDVALIVEVADTTYKKDSGVKRRRYERCGIPIYWIVDLPRRRVEVYEMSSRGLSLTRLFHDAESVPLALDGRDYDGIPVAELLP